MGAASGTITKLGAKRLTGREKACRGHYPLPFGPRTARHPVRRTNREVSDLMPRRPFAVLLAGLILLAAAALPAAAQTRYPPGLRVGLTVPGDLKPSSRFSGFEDEDRKVAIAILDMPVAALEGLERSAYADAQGKVENLKREAFPFENGIAVLVSGIASENGAKVHKWFLVASSATGPVRDLATLVSVEVPEAALSVYSDAVIRDALRSVTFRPAPIQEQLSLLPFRINDIAGFRVMQVLPGGVIMIDGVEDDITSRPYVIVAIGRGNPEPADRGRFAADLLSQAPLRNLQMQSSEALRISNGAGHEIRAQAESVNGRKVQLVQWVRFGGSGFLRIIGVANNDQWETMFNRFRAVRDGIEPRG